jgi:hypothetical protein
MCAVHTARRVDPRRGTKILMSTSPTNFAPNLYIWNTNTVEDLVPLCENEKTKKSLRN